MSVDTKETNGLPPEDAKGNQEEISKQDENDQPDDSGKVAYGTYTKVLGQRTKLRDELKSERERSAEIANKLRTYKERELEKKGEQSKLIESLRERAAKAESSKKELEQKYAYRIVSGQIRNVAERMGCVDPEKLLKLTDFSGVEIDENLKANEDDIKLSLEKSKADMPYFFRKDVNPVRDAPPSTKPVIGKSNGFEKMSLKDKTLALAKMLK